MAILKTGKMIGVCIHHSAVKPGAENKSELKKRASSYNTTHSKKSWAAEIKTKGEFGYPYIEYHYMIAKDGYLLQVQDEKYVLYHAGDVFRGASSFNLHGIAIMLDGNYEKETPTDAQMLTLVKLIRDIQARYKIDALVRGHKETSQTATSCPGKNIGISSSGWLKKVIKNVNDKNYPPVIVTPPVEPPVTPQPTGPVETPEIPQEPETPIETPVEEPEVLTTPEVENQLNVIEKLLRLILEALGKLFKK